MFGVLIGTPGINWADLFARVRGEVGLKHDTLARMMGISPQQLSMQLAGNGHVSLFRLTQAAADDDPVGKRFVETLLRLISHELGFGATDPTAAAVANLMVSVGHLMNHMQLRMAKAELADSGSQRRSA